MWERLGHDTSVFEAEWPVHNEEAMKEEEMKIPLQINGKTKGILKIAVGTDKETILAKGKEILGKKLSAEPIKEIYVPGKIVNFVVRK